MAIGERIRWFRKRHGLTQRELGLKLGFTNKTADLRIRQYETGLRNPKEGTIKDLAQVFDVAEEALSVPDIDSYIGLMHTLFTLEDMYGLTVIKIDDQVCLRPDVNHPNYSLSLAEDLNAWCEIKEKRMNGIIRFEEYDQWRYSYPKDKALSVKASIDDAK
jgi:transcriptional regulator with XRE-family HTH domain